MFLFSLSVFCFGLIIGSFLNVFILRRGARSLRGRSACFSCQTPIKWYDLVPVFSWINLRGRCRACGSRISRQYPLVELATGVLFAVIALVPLPLPAFIAALVIAAISIAIVVYDIRHTIIPDVWVLVLITASACFVCTFEPNGSSDWLFRVLGPLAAATPLFLLWLVSKGAWMGLGDVKLALAIGILLGPIIGPYAIMAAFMLGAAVMVPLLFFSSKKWADFVARFTPTPISKMLVWGFTMKSEVPFGPFLIASELMIWFALLFQIPLPILNTL